MGDFSSSEGQRIIAGLIFTLLAAVAITSVIAVWAVLWMIFTVLNIWDWAPAYYMDLATGTVPIFQWPLFTSSLFLGPAGIILWCWLDHRHDVNTKAKFKAKMEKGRAEEEKKKKEQTK